MVSNGSIASRLGALERRHLPPRAGGVRVIVMTCIADPDPPAGSLDAFLGRHPPCCARGWVRTVEWNCEDWREEHPRCWSCREAREA